MRCGNGDKRLDLEIVETVIESSIGKNLNEVRVIQEVGNWKRNLQDERLRRIDYYCECLLCMYGCITLKC